MARRTAQSSLTPALDITAGLQKFGLGKYVALFERLEIGKPMMELCEQHAGIWDELFADPAGLGMVEQGDRARLVGQMGAILQYCAAVQAEEAASVSLANRYLQPAPEPAPPPFQPSPQLPPTPVLPHQPPAAHGQFSTPMAQPPPIAAKPQQLSAMPPAQQPPSLPQKPPAQQLSAPPPSLPQKPPPGQLSTPAGQPPALPQKPPLEQLALPPTAPTADGGSGGVTVYKVARKAIVSDGVELDSAQAPESLEKGAFIQAFEEITMGDGLRVRFAQGWTSTVAQSGKQLLERVGSLSEEERAVMSSLPGVRDDLRVGLWLEKKSPAKMKGWQRRWCVLDPYSKQFHWFLNSDAEDLEDTEDQRWISLQNCTHITSNNLEAGHFELHTPAKTYELRVEDKTRASLQIIEEIFAGIATIGALSPENDGMLQDPSFAPTQEPEQLELPRGTPRAASAPGGPLPGGVTLPGAREDGRVGLWLEKKSPARMKGWQQRWCVFDPYSKQFHWFLNAESEDLEDTEDQRWISLQKCTHITSNNLEAGHFELHTTSKVYEMRVGDKTRESLRGIEEIFACLLTIGALAPENDGTLKDVEYTAQVEEAKAAASTEYKSMIGMTFSELDVGSLLRVVGQAPVVNSGSGLDTEEVGRLEPETYISVLQKKTTDAGFLRVRFDNGSLKGWTSVASYDCRLLVELVEEEARAEALLALRTADATAEGRDATAVDMWDPNLGWYRAVRKAAIRAGFSQDSPKLGDLEVGTEIEVVRSKTSEDGRLRVEFKDGAAVRGGWVSVTNKDGAAIVEPVGTAPQTLPGARKDGTLGLWLEKKSPARGKGWQKRWFVFQADGEVRYFTDPSKENLADAPAAGMYGAAQTPKKKKQAFSLTLCTKITSSNPDGGYFDLHFDDKTMVLRTYDASAPFQAIEKIEEIFRVVCANNGLAPGNTGAIEREQPEEGTPADGGADEAQPPAKSKKEEKREKKEEKKEEKAAAAATAGVEEWLTQPPHDFAEVSELVVGTLRGSNIAAKKWIETLDNWWNFSSRPMTKEELEAFMLTVSQSSDATLDLESRGFSLPDAQGQQIALPDAREEDGACGMWLEKKSPSKVKGWQRRWFVIHPGGKVLYYTDPKKEALRTPQRDKQMFSLTVCTRITSQNKQDGQFELHFAEKTVNLRVPERSLEALGPVEDLFAAMHANGVLPPENDGRIHEDGASNGNGATPAVPGTPAPPPPASVPDPQWEKIYSEEYQQHYWANVQTGETTWTEPVIAPPPPKSMPPPPGSGPPGGGGDAAGHSPSLDEQHQRMLANSRMRQEQMASRGGQ